MGTLHDAMWWETGDTDPGDATLAPGTPHTIMGEGAVCTVLQIAQERRSGNVLELNAAEGMFDKGGMTFGVFHAPGHCIHR